MDLVSDRGRRVSVDELNTTRLLAHARQQAHQRKLDDILIVDVDAHHYESEHMSEILPFMENDVLRQLSIQGRSRNSLLPQVIGYQDMGGRVTRYPLRSSEKTEPGRIRDVQLGERWMDAMGVDYSCLFPTGMLSLGTHPQKEMEVELCWAYAAGSPKRCCRRRTAACIPCSTCRSPTPMPACDTSSISATARA